MRSRASRFQVVALLAAASVGLHEARFLLSGGGLERHLGQGHAYLALLVPGVAALAVVALGLFVRRLALAEPGDGAPEVSTLAVWLAASIGLLAIFVGQESLESLVASGHGSALHAAVGHGGWIVVGLAHLFGAVVAFVLRGARALTAAVARRRGARLRPAGARRPDFSRVGFLQQLAAWHLAPRGPPAHSLI